MKKCVALGTGVVMAAAFSATAANADFTRGLRAFAETDYIFRGEQRAEHTAFLQGKVEISDFYVEGLYAQPFGDNNEQVPNEVRARFGWTPDVFSNLAEADFGVQAYAFPDSGDFVAFEDEERLEGFAGLTLNVPLSPQAHVYYDFDNDVFTTEAGIYQYVGLPFLFGIRAEVDAGYVARDEDGAENYGYIQARADVVKQFLFGIEAFAGARAAITSEETIFDDLSDLGPVFDDDPTSWFGAGASFTF